MMKIIDNLLSEKELELMKTIMMHNQDMPWYFNDYIASHRANDPMYYFVHHFLFEYEKSSWFYVIEPILNFIKPKILISFNFNYTFITTYWILPITCNIIIIHF